MAKIIIGNVKGKDGRGITEITKTASTDTVDTYTITYTDNTTSTFTINKSSSVLLQRQIVPSAAVESSTTASQAYTAGDYVVVGGVLRKVKSSIAKGSTISDSNSTSTTVAGEIKTVRDSVSREVGYQFLYGKDFSSAHVAYRKKGFLVEMYWNFAQETAEIWTAGTLPVGFRPTKSFLAPAVRTQPNGIVDNSTAEVEVMDSGAVNFICAAAVTGGRNIGHCIWIAA
jgi:hypothetical protein